MLAQKKKKKVKAKTFCWEKERRRTGTFLFTRSSLNQSAHPATAPFRAGFTRLRFVLYSFWAAITLRDVNSIVLLMLMRRSEKLEPLLRTLY